MAVDRSRPEGPRTSASPAKTAIDQPWITVLGVGDSTLTGDGLSSQEEVWLNVALDRIDDRNLRLVNGAEPGARLSHINPQLRELRHVDAQVAVIAVGTNDITSLRRLAGLWRYRARYRRILEAMTDRIDAVVATGVGDLSLSARFDDNLALSALKPLARFASWYVNRQIQLSIDGLDDNRNVYYVDARKADRRLAEGKQWLFSPDRFHPNARGHEIWGELAVPVLKDALASSAEFDSSPSAPRLVPTRMGMARVRGMGPATNRHAVVLIPDLPNVLEHYDQVLEKIVEKLGQDARVLALEMPGLGMSHATGRYDYGLRLGAEWIESVLEQEGIDTTTIATTCINGLYAAKFAQVYPERVRGLVLGQTPPLAEIKRWGTSVIWAPLRWPLVDGPAMRLLRRHLVAIWYRRALSDETDRSLYEKMATEAIERGAQWRLGKLYRAIMREQVDPLKQSDDGNFSYLAGLQPVFLWGRNDGTHDDQPDWDDLETVASGHCPDLEATDEFVKRIVAVERSL